jgi:hypothetical protein
VPENDDDPDGEDDFPLPNKINKAKKDKKTKVPAAFSLMHGFTATNVGKNRLTVSHDCYLLSYILPNFYQWQLKPGTSIGVFGKGKASAKTRVLTKKTAIKNGAFYSAMCCSLFISPNHRANQ